MVDWDHPVFPVSVQAQMLSLNRSSLYYRSRPISEWDMQLNRLIDITYTKHPEFGHRRIAAWLGTYLGSRWNARPYWPGCGKWAYRPFTPGRVPAAGTRPIKFIRTF